ncbi:MULTISPECIES: ABC transporter ATP-binding protein [Pseudomonas]|uniref:ABC transporter ATP-binding protein n=1 Tax=Pseudomonas TaxID=286 RepID=UPI00257DE1CA|nr:MULTISPECIES: ATP-binding cassette domain-containing protein [Pseudomonas]
MLEFHNVSAFQQDTQVLEGFSLTIKAGERVAILGPNGAGKSTVLKLIGREIYPVDKPGSHFKLFGKETLPIWEVRNKIGFMSQGLQDDYTPYTKVLDVVVSGFFGAVGRHDHLTPSAEQIASAQAILQVVGMADCQDAMFQRLSAGQQRRLLLARAFIHQPELLIFDEPTNHLDVGVSKTILDLMRAFCRDSRGVIVTTHNVTDVIPEIDRVILLQRGRILLDGPKHEVMTNQNLSELYQADLRVEHDRGWYHLRYA